MFVTCEYAREMLCPNSGGKRLKCVADRCMAWRPVTVWAAFITYADKNTDNNTIFSWKLTKQEGAHAVDCGFCGKSGAPHFDADIRAPLGYDETSLIGLTNTGRKKTPARSLNKYEKALMKKRGLIIAHDDGQRSPKGQYYFIKKGKKA